MSSEIIVAIILGLLAASPGVYAIYRQKPRDEAEITERIQKSVMALLDVKDKRITELEAQVARMEILLEAIAEDAQGSLKLYYQLKAEAIEPKYIPLKLRKNIRVDIKAE